VPTVITLEDLREARARVAPVIRDTPLTRAGALGRLVGRPLWCKGEHLQRTGSYKIRGAYNRISRLDPLTSPAGVVAGSAGNHAQGVALAARLSGIPSTIYMPTTAPLPKVAATRSYGAEVRLEGTVVDDCILAALAHAERTGATFVPPFDDPHIIAGQGTVGLELAEGAPDAEVVVVPVGGGGLIAGVATALAHTRPGTKVVGVEAAGAACMRGSLDAGRATVLERVTTMADGIAVRSPSALTLAHVQAYVDDVVTVTEEEISQAVLLLLERSKAVVEPAGAVGLAALLAGKVPGTGPAVTILTGGNVDPLLLVKMIDHGLSATGRYLVVRVLLGDRPGALASLTATLAGLGLNVLSVEHHRAGLGLGVDEVEVLVTLETRDPDHRGEIVAAIGAAGFTVERLR
jgi:threonine dehydratase